MDELDVCVLTIRYHATPRGIERVTIAKRLCAATGETSLNHALQVGQDLVKRSTNYYVVKYRKDKAAQAERSRRLVAQARRRADWQNHRMLNDH